MIGLVNTPEGGRIKLISNSPITKSLYGYSWNSSSSNVNGGDGVNEWSISNMQELLNNGAYYNRESGTCYTGNGNATGPCDFSEIGLYDFAKEMIDTITWNTGTQGSSDNSLLSPVNMYNYERSNNTGKICTTGNRCNDTVARTTTWVGKVGLMYPSDYGYATIGSTSKSREACLTTSMYSWGDSENASCKAYNWLLTRGWQWTMTPAAYLSDSAAVFNIYGDGRLRYHSAFGTTDSYPTVYLKEDVKYISGVGSVNNPYRICAD